MNLIVSDYITILGTIYAKLFEMELFNCIY